MEIFFLLMAIACLPAAIARGKGYSFFIFWIYAVVFFPIALIHSLVLKTDQAALDGRALSGGGNVKCPFCAEIVRAEAQVCRHCGRDIPPPKASHVRHGLQKHPCPACGIGVSLAADTCPHCRSSLAETVDWRRRRAGAA